MSRDVLELIKLVNDTQSPIHDLMTLALILKGNKETQEEYDVCMVTINSHYSFNLYLSTPHQDANKHVDKVLSSMPTMKQYIS